MTKTYSGDDSTYSISDSRWTKSSDTLAKSICQTLAIACESLFSSFSQNYCTYSDHSLSRVLKRWVCVRIGKSGLCMVSDCVRLSNLQTTLSCAPAQGVIVIVQKNLTVHLDLSDGC